MQTFVSSVLEQGGLEISFRLTSCGQMPQGVTDNFKEDIF